MSTTTPNPAFGQTIRQADIDSKFLTGPGEDLVTKTLLQMSLIQNDTTNAFVELFGPYTPPKAGQNQTASQRWADYCRYDWSIRQLPAINIYEAEAEDKTSSNGWLNGTINLMVFWPPNQRRSDWARVPAAFKGAVQNFFESKFIRDMLDELYWIERPAKVAGLNEYGKVMVWTPNVEGIIETELVPVTLVNVKYRLDLRAWYRALEFQNRTKDQPFQTPLGDLTVIGGEYDGLVKGSPDTQTALPDEITVTQG